MPVKTWSASASIIETLIEFPHDPGLFAANTTSLKVFSEYPSSL